MGLDGGFEITSKDSERKELVSRHWRDSAEVDCIDQKKAVWIGGPANVVIKFESEE